MKKDIIKMFMESKRFLTLVVLLGIFGKCFIKCFTNFSFLEIFYWNHSVREDDLYTRRLPHFIIVGVKKCGTSKSFAVFILHETFC